MKFKTILASMLAIVALSGCDDLLEEDNMGPDGSNPSLTINNPTNNQSVSQTKGLRIYVTAVDKDAVKVDVAVKGHETNFITYSKVSRKNVVDFDTLVSVENLAPGTYQLVVRATDGRTNVSEEQVNFILK
jgi:hypothetical protein